MREAFSWLVTICFTGMVGVYVYFFKQFHDAVASHQNLLHLFSDPKVRVASGQEADQIIQILNAPEQKPVQPVLTAEQRKSELHMKLQALMPQLQTQTMVSAPTLANLPPSSRSKTNYEYSLCESIDYQRESLSAPLVEN